MEFVIDETFILFCFFIFTIGITCAWMIYDLRKTEMANYQEELK